MIYSVLYSSENSEIHKDYLCSNELHSEDESFNKVRWSPNTKQRIQNAWSENVVAAVSSIAEFDP